MGTKYKEHDKNQPKSQSFMRSSKEKKKHEKVFWYDLRQGTVWLKSEKSAPGMCSNSQKNKAMVHNKWTAAISEKKMKKNLSKVKKNPNKNEKS